MGQKIKTFFKEVAWLLALGGITLLIAEIIFSNGSIDIQLHDTYFVFSGWSFLVPLFLFLTFIVFFIREKRASYKREPQNWILTISGMMLVLYLTYLVQQFLTTEQSWTAYPPLSELKRVHESKIAFNPRAIYLGRILILIQGLVLAAVSYVLYCWGKNKTLQGKK